MPRTRLEHANITVSDLTRTVSWMENVFGWKVRWEGPSIHNGSTVHIGAPDSYLALYQSPNALATPPDSYNTRAALNHLAVVVDDLDATEERVASAGFTPRSHADYEPGRRFYFEDHDGIEYEVVQY
ncbi:VOC family protein [Celeribacter arenosi]|uniref:VOC family protein n=1 Tax=Celeribacter arenosi TaxID=792649 RepID=A0ABP7JW58_9RHOB